jgi:YegS/Rv2252/BmrU family lipid kinase
MSKKKIRFITNPFSGPKSGVKIEQLIKVNINEDIYDYEITNTEYAGHATILAREAVKDNYFAVIAIGGDGTINEVGTALVHTDTALGIIPFGSGNGFSYHLGIRRNVVKAIRTLNDCHVTQIDTGLANGRFFINVAGLGLDATVAYKTKLNSFRGFIPYFINTLRESINFKYLKLHLKTKDKEWEGEYAMAVIANGSVYGYDFTIAPQALLNDGQFDIVLVKRTQVFRYFFLVPRMLNKTIHKSSLVNYFKTDEITIVNKLGGYFHVDGEGFVCDESIHFKVQPSSLLLLNNL